MFVDVCDEMKLIGRKETTIHWMIKGMSQAWQEGSSYYA